MLLRLWAGNGPPGSPAAARRLVQVPVTSYRPACQWRCTQITIKNQWSPSSPADRTFSSNLSLHPQLNYFSLVLPSIFDQLGLFSLHPFSSHQLRILGLSPEEQHRKLSVLTSSTVTLPRIDVASAYASARVPQRKKKKNSFTNVPQPSQWQPSRTPKSPLSRLWLPRSSPRRPSLLQLPLLQPANPPRRLKRLLSRPPWSLRPTLLTPTVSSRARPGSAPIGLVANDSHRPPTADVCQYALPITPFLFEARLPRHPLALARHAFSFLLSSYCAP